KSTSAETKPKPAPVSPAQPTPPPPPVQPPSTVGAPRAPKKDFIANVYHEDVVEQAIDQQKKADGDSRSALVNTSDNRSMWAQNLMLKKPIRALAKEFAANKKIKPADYTTEAYEKNDAKNRYNDIICIDATRVVLKDRPPDDDYIHASWMTMPDGQKYICTQGPLQEYVGDFWHMITSEKCRVIVMLCNFNEAKVKRALFIIWPILNGRPTIRTPLNPAPTVGMLRLSRNLSARNPITVHCSAAIDYASLKIREKSDASMVDVVRDMRNQRYQAIQSAIQYVFLHICVLEIFASVS
ncbi:Protein-tyrosine phosphatase, partial [Cooperia oncophora]